MRVQLATLLCGLALWLPGLLAQAAAPAAPAGPVPDLTSSRQLALGPWLARLQAAPARLNYSGVFVVVAGTEVTSARIWHKTYGQQQMDRIETLTGQPRITFRRNDVVATFLPASRTVIHETREALNPFSDARFKAQSSVAQFYHLRPAGQGRVAGLPAQIFQLLPLDALRYGYRIWLEQENGLLLKLQTLSPDGAVLEQVAFFELEFKLPLDAVGMAAMMDDTQGWRSIKVQSSKISLEAAGWQLVSPVPGFALRHCYTRADASGALQCVFSDGLASVSLFIEKFDASRHARLLAQGPVSNGATSLRARRIGSWCLSAVGEVPASTLIFFTQAVARKD